jgi:hypothetical protein
MMFGISGPFSFSKSLIALKVILNWKEIYRLPFITTKSSKLQWFQYRIIHRILGTNSLLYKINQKRLDILLHDQNICSIVSTSSKQKLHLSFGF